jgi:hypothetical protein
MRKAGFFLPFAGITRIRFEGLPHSVRSLSHRNGAPRSGNRVESLPVLVNCIYEWRLGLHICASVMLWFRFDTGCPALQG